MHFLIRTAAVSVALLPSIALASFTDVSTNHPYSEAINFVQTKGIVQGYPNGTYKPDNKINRAEFVKIVTSATLSPAQIRLCFVHIKALFSDTPANEWYWPYACAALQQNMVGGYPDGSFRPANNISFAEAAKIITEGLKVPAPASGSACMSDYNRWHETSGQLGDDGNPYWWQQYTCALQAIDVLPPTYQKPDQLLTRGEMAFMIQHTLTKMQATNPNVRLSATEGSVLAVLDANPDKLQQTISQVIRMSNDGQYVLTAEAVVTNDGDFGDFSVQINDVELGTYEYARLPTTSFSPSGDSFFYVVSSSTGDMRKESVEVITLSNGKIVSHNSEGPFDGLLSEPIYSPDGEHISYVAQVGGKVVIIQDAKIFSTQGDLLRTQQLRYSKNGHLFYVTLVDNEWILMRDQKEMARSDSAISSYYISDDGEHTAFGTFGSQENAVVWDGKKGPVHSSVSQLAMRSDGKEIAYIASDYKPVFHTALYVNHKEANAQNVDRLQYLPDGTLVYVSSDDQLTEKKLLNIDGTEVTSFRPPIWNAMLPSMTAFSAPDGTIGFVAKYYFSVPGTTVTENSSYIVLGTKKHGIYDTVSEPVFSPDGKHMAYKATWTNKQLLVVDGKEEPFVDEIWGPFFPSNGMVTYVARFGENIVLVQRKL